MVRIRWFLCLVATAALTSACSDAESKSESPGDATTVATSAAPDETSVPAEYPQAMPEGLVEPFAGDPVPDAWLAEWADAASAAEWRIHGADSAECAAITEGRTSCFENGPSTGPSVTPDELYSAGAITRAGEKIVLRMTFVPARGAPGVTCFDDDRYAYRLSEGDQLELLLDGADHCFYEAEEAREASKAGTLPKGVFTVWSRTD